MANEDIRINPSHVPLLILDTSFFFFLKKILVGVN